MKITTLCYPIQDTRVLLAMKKRGFGEGKWNGPGGKVQEGESIEDACRRETLEESGVIVGALERRGIVRFKFEGKPEWENECHVFITTDISGQPRETEEMRPAWFEIAAIPYGDMWEDDAHWLPDVLSGGRVDRTFFFDGDGKLIRE